jgi:hypothetical protein
LIFLAVTLAAWAGAVYQFRHLELQRRLATRPS